VIRALTLAGALALSGAHPLHTTFTEIVQDPSTHAVTVTVRSFSDDLARAIGAPVPAPGHPSSLADSALARYVSAHLTFVDGAGHRLSLSYTGQRQSADLSWITFVVPVQSGISGVAVSDQLQVELYPDQVNLVQASYGSRRETLLFSPGDAARTLP
jgi:hypothetical protein